MDSGPSAAETAIAITAVAGGLLAFTVVACMIAWLWLSSSRTRAIASKESAYQALAEEMAESQRKAAADLEQLRGDIEDLRPRIAEIERMIKEVG